MGGSLYHSPGHSFQFIQAEPTHGLIDLYSMISSSNFLLYQPISLGLAVASNALDLGFRSYLRFPAFAGQVSRSPFLIMSYSTILYRNCQVKNELYRNFFHRNHTSATPIAPQQRPSIKSCSSYNIESFPFRVYIHSIPACQGFVKHFLRECVIFLSQVQKKRRYPANFNHIDSMFFLTFL